MCGKGSMVEGGSVAWWKGMGRVWQLWVQISVWWLLAVWLWVVSASLSCLSPFRTIRVMLLLQSVLRVKGDCICVKCVAFDSCSWRHMCVFGHVISVCWFSTVHFHATHSTSTPFLVATFRVPVQDSVPLGYISCGVGPENVCPVIGVCIWGRKSTQCPLNQNTRTLLIWVINILIQINWKKNNPLGASFISYWVFFPYHNLVTLRTEHSWNVFVNPVESIFSRRLDGERRQRVINPI